MVFSNSCYLSVPVAEMVEPWEFEVGAQNTWQDAAQGADADGLGEHLVACSRTSKGPSKNEKQKLSQLTSVFGGGSQKHFKTIRNTTLDP